MLGVLFDTSMYVSALRDGDWSPLLARTWTLKGERAVRPLWLSAVVLEELYAGAQDRQTKSLCASIEKSFLAVGRLLVPIGSDWTACGQILSRIGNKYGYEQIGKSRLTNDALIAVSASRNGIAILTKNVKDFKTISEFRAFRWEAI